MEKKWTGPKPRKRTLRSGSEERRRVRVGERKVSAECLGFRKKGKGEKP